jgi:two-component system nitrate/nitrite response regulator NarL
MTTRDADNEKPGGDMIRVLLVDDHTLFRSGIRSLLVRQQGFEIVGEAGDGLEGLKRAKSLKPDVVLLDLHMRGMSGLEAVRLITEEVPESNVLMLTVSEDSEDLLEALRGGACGYLLKNIDTEALVEAIRRAAEGESVISPQMTGKLVQGVRRPLRDAAPSDKEKLSPREREILALLAKGVSNKEIARGLDLAESTVKIHVQGILRKLGLSSRVQAAVYAVEHGLVAREGA